MNFAKVFDKSHHWEILDFGHKTWNLGNIYEKVSFIGDMKITASLLHNEGSRGQDLNSLNDKFYDSSSSCIQNITVLEHIITWSPQVNYLIMGIESV